MAASGRSRAIERLYWVPMASASIVSRATMCRWPRLASGAPKLGHELLDRLGAFAGQTVGGKAGLDRVVVDLAGQPVRDQVDAPVLRAHGHRRSGECPRRSAGHSTGRAGRLGRARRESAGRPRRRSARRRRAACRPARPRGTRSRASGRPRAGATGRLRRQARRSSSSSGPLEKLELGSVGKRSFSEGESPRLTGGGHVTGVEPRVVSPHRSHPHRDRIGGCAHLVHDPAALLAGDPAGSGQGDAAVERDRDLVRDEGAPESGPRPPGLVLPPCLEGVDQLGLDAGGAQLLESAAVLGDEDRASPRRRARFLPRAPRPRTAACCRGASRAPWSRRASRRGRARRPPRWRSPRRAARLSARASPRRPPRRPARSTAPTTGLGYVSAAAALRELQRAFEAHCTASESSR